MPKLLHIDVSPRGDRSLSRALSAAYVDKWKQVHPDGTVVRRDLATSNLTFVDIEWIAGAFSPPDQHNEAHKKALALSDTLIDELLSADTVIIGTPMYNFSIPAAFKAWIDHVVRAGKTFTFSAAGLQGLAAGKKVVVAIAAGQRYDQEPMSSMNQEIPYLKTIFGFIGVTDLQFEMAGGGGEVSQQKISEQDFLAPHITHLQQLAAQ